MQSYKGRFEPTRFEDLSVTVDFRCHSACRFCIVQEGMNYFRGVPFDVFCKAVDDNAKALRYKRVIFTGGEVTLDPRLFDYVGYARAAGCFQHIRLQTNGRKLADAAFARALVEAGIDEFFVSLHGHDAATQDHISQRPGSFDEAMRGMQNLAELPVTLMTNTVLTTLNVAHLADIVDTVRPLRPTRMEFWNYLPMEDYADERDLLAPIAVLGPALQSALARCREGDIEAVVKYVPRCILGPFGDAQDNSQPDVVIVEKFYDLYPKFACLHEARCEHAESCLGLHHPYIDKFGWEEDALQPTPRTTPWQEPEYGPWMGADRPGARKDEADLVHPEWRALVDGVAERRGGRLVDVLVQRRACVYRFEVDDASVDVVLTARDEGMPALVRSRSFNLHYRNVQGRADLAKGPLAELVRAVAETVVSRDRGELALALRKGLVGPEAFRRRPA